MHDALDATSGKLGGLDDLARLDSPVHRLDARVKVLVTLAFAATAISFSKYSLGPLAPLFLYPAVVIGLAGLPVSPLARRLLPVTPLILLVGAANPLLDRQVVAHVGEIGITGGWLSFGSIVARLVLTLLAALLLVATTGIHEVCRALERLGLPRVLATQILLMVRYLFVLGDEAGRMRRAHALRAGGSGVALRLAGPLLGQWLLRTIDRARRIHQAMLARGFDGTLRRLETSRPGWSDAAWLAGWCAFFFVARLMQPGEALGRALLGALGS